MHVLLEASCLKVVIIIVCPQWTLVLYLVKNQKPLIIARNSIAILCSLFNIFEDIGGLYNVVCWSLEALLEIVHIIVLLIEDVVLVEVVDLLPNVHLIVCVSLVWYLQVQHVSRTFALDNLWRLLLIFQSIGRILTKRKVLFYVFFGTVWITNFDESLRLGVYIVNIILLRAVCLDWLAQQLLLVLWENLLPAISRQEIAKPRIEERVLSCLLVLTIDHEMSVEFHLAVLIIIFKIAIITCWYCNAVAKCPSIHWEIQNGVVIDQIFGVFLKLLHILDVFQLLGKLIMIAPNNGSLYRQYNQ